MPELFESTSINSLTLKNRFVRSATWEGMATAEGECTGQLTEYMRQLAAGDVGLIISGHSHVLPVGQASFRQLGVYDDSLVPGLRNMTDAVHEAGGVIVMQIAHAGVHARTDLTGMEAAGPSPFAGADNTLSRQMSREEIAETVRAFGAAASRAKEAGFDGVQIHSAHGYLLSQFLSPYYNKREDEYGGSLENRSRMLMEVYDAVRGAVGKDFPVMIKINSEDFVEGEGFTVDEMLQVSRMLQEAGIDAIEMSGGTQNSGRKLSPVRAVKIKTEDDEVFYKDAAKRFQQEIPVPLILVGGIRSFSTAERLVREGTADYIALSRPLIREPHLVKRWKSGDTGPARCLSDNLCFRPAVEGKGIYCVVEEKEQEA